MFLDGSSYAEIAASVAVPKEWLKRHAHYKQWYALRQSPEHRQQALAALDGELKQWTEQLAVETQSLSLDAVPVVRDAIERGSARDLKDSAQGLKTLVELGRLTSGLDAEKPSEGPRTIAFFVARIGDSIREVVRPEVNITPVAIARVIDDPEF